MVMMRPARSASGRKFSPGQQLLQCAAACIDDVLARVEEGQQHPTQTPLCRWEVRPTPTYCVSIKFQSLQSSFRRR